MIKNSTMYRLITTTHTAYGVEVEDRTYTGRALLRAMGEALRREVIVDTVRDGKPVTIRARALSHTFVLSEVAA